MIWPVEKQRKKELTEGKGESLPEGHGRPKRTAAGGCYGSNEIEIVEPGRSCEVVSGGNQPANRLATKSGQVGTFVERSLEKEGLKVWWKLPVNAAGSSYEDRALDGALPAVLANFAEGRTQDWVPGR